MKAPTLEFPFINYFRETVHWDRVARPEKRTRTTGHLKFGQEISAKEYARKKDDLPFGDYLENLREELDYSVKVRLPEGFPEGSVFRSGPGVYSRGDQRRNNVIDADGMLREYRFGPGDLRVRTRVLRTSRFCKENEKNQYAGPSFSMRPTSSRNNSSTSLKNQASLAVLSFGGKLLVGDEMQPLTWVDQESLDILDENVLGKLPQYAHQKVCGDELHSLVLRPEKLGAQVVTYDRDFNIKYRSDVFPLNMSCFHDWSVTKDHFVFVLPSTITDPMIFAKSLFGKSTLTQSVNFRKDTSARVLVVNKHTGKVCFNSSIDQSLACWHHVNAFEANNMLVVRFIANESPSNLSSADASYYQLMKGNDTQDGRDQSTYVHKVIADLGSGQVVFSGEDHTSVKGIEMPTLKQELIGKAQRYYYSSAGPEFLQNRIVKVDLVENTLFTYSFEPHQYVSEALFVPRTPSIGKEDDGFLVVDVHDGSNRTNYVHIFDARDISQGPIFTHKLPIPLPIAFHGTWSPITR